MSGERSLGALLQHLEPILDETEFGFGRVPSGSELPLTLSAFGIIEEDEGTTVIAFAESLRAHGIEHSTGWAKISLTVHSALDAVGLTAAIATALARDGISANVVAGYYHDHLFVPWERRHEALAALAGLSSDKASAYRPAG